MSQSLPARLQALQVLTDVSPKLPDVQQALAGLGREKVAQAQRLPSMEEAAGPAEVFHVASLEMLLRRPLMILRTLELQCMKPDSPDNRTIASIGTAQCIALSSSEAFDPVSGNKAMTGNLLERLPNGDDILRAAYCACLYLTSAALDFKHVVR
jgi:hypothetical protein